MLFNSISYLIFFPVVIGLYFLLPHRFRWMLLLGASYYFYICWRPLYVVLLLIQTSIDYFAARLMESSTTARQKKVYLTLSVLSNLSLLFYFKYYNFFFDSLHQILHIAGIEYAWPLMQVVLPVGISFHTFQSIAYCIDVYRGVVKPERHFGIFALYVCFFPQLVAGPIERPSDMLPQFRETHRFNRAQVVAGLQLILWGMFKKVVIADRLAVIVNQVYSAPLEYSSSYLLLATYCFTFQIFCDFSGYSDIARGSALVMGFRLFENFRRPYFSQSIAEFWTRWHISLSFWFRDYLYIPLGGNRVPLGRWYFNLALVFLVSGLWHGASWTFVVWGALHAAYVLGGDVIKRSFQGAFIWLKEYPRLSRCVFTAVTFHCAVLAWVFFRAESLSDAWHIVTMILSGWGTEGLTRGLIGVTSTSLALSAVSIVVMESVHLLQECRLSPRELLHRLPQPLRWAAYYSAVLLILFLGRFSETEFIYFQF